MTADTKECPFCGEIIKVIAKKCRHCGEFLDGYTRDKVYQEINTGGGTVVGKDVDAGRDFVGRDLKQKFRMSWETRGGCLNVYFITQAATVLIIIFLGTMAYQTPEIQTGARRLVEKYLERIERENIPPTPVVLPTLVPIFTPMPTPTPCTINIPIGWKPYSITNGKRLSLIAAETGTTIEKLRKVNCLEGIGDVIPGGTSLILAPPPTPSISQVKEDLIARADASPILNMYNQEAVQFINNLLGRLNEFQLASLGITKTTMLNALMRTDAGDRINAIVNDIWQDWLNRAKENGFDANTTDPDNIGDLVSPFRKLIIRMIQGSKAILADSEQHALYNYFSRDEDPNVWANNITSVIGAVNRESFRWP